MNHIGKYRHTNLLFFERSIIMKIYEKSVGAIIYYIDEQHDYYFLVQQHVNGDHWAFAKGHVEDGETEYETALREVHEETGLLEVTLDMNFRESTVYSPKENVEKEVVYFIARTTPLAAKAVVKQDIEIKNIEFLNLEDAVNRVTFENDKKILKKAFEYLVS